MTLAQLREQTDGDPAEIAQRISTERTVRTDDYDFGGFIYQACKGKMSSRPEFYSGYGPDPHNIGPSHLKMLHDAIREDFGETAGLQFLRFVVDTRDMSASSFLTAFQRFWYGGMLASAAYQRPTDRMGMDGIGTDHEDEATRSALFAGMTILLRDKTSPEQRDLQSAQIKMGFLQQVGVEIPRDGALGLGYHFGGGRFGERIFYGSRKSYGDE
jgi:hypothetical protein